jgi:hypothetical protein
MDGGTANRTNPTNPDFSDSTQKLDVHCGDILPGMSASSSCSIGLRPSLVEKGCGVEVELRK